MLIKRSWFNIYFEWFLRYFRTLPQISLRTVFGVFFWNQNRKTDLHDFPWFLGYIFWNIWDKISAGSWVQKGYFWLWKYYREFLAYFLGWIIHQVKKILFFMVWLKKWRKLRAQLLKICGIHLCLRHKQLVGEFTILAAQAQREN